MYLKIYYPIPLYIYIIYIIKKIMRKRSSNEGMPKFKEIAVEILYMQLDKYIHIHIYGIE